MVVMIVGILLMVFQNEEFLEWLIYTRSLQFILHISLMNIAMPGNVIEFYSILYQLSNFDFVGFINLWNLPYFN
jgi:hypothetical protein